MPRGLVLLLALPALVVACSEDTAPPTAPEFAKGGTPTVVVNTLSDTPTDVGCTKTDCTLREAIAAAPSGSIITFNVSGTIALDVTNFQNPLEISDKTLTIKGPSGGITLDGGHTCTGGEAPPCEGGQPLNGTRVFIVHNTATLTLQNLTIRRGFATASGGGIVNEGTLTLMNAIVTENSIEDPEGPVSTGGGIWNSSTSTLTLVNTTVSRNFASKRGGGILIGGSATLIGSTVTGNVSALGGGIAAFGPLTLKNSSVTGNTAGGDGDAGGGGGIHLVGVAAILTLAKQSCVNNNEARSSGDLVTSSVPWDPINIDFVQGATATGLNCGVAQP